MIDLQRVEHAYLMGFLLGDGTSYQGRGRKGRLSIELHERDEELLLRLAPLMPGALLSRRERRTNFAEVSRTCVLSWCRSDVRNAVTAAGMPSGRKDAVIAPPEDAHSERDLARGFFDADGSIGFTGRGFPFLSVVTKSPAMAQWWIGLLSTHAATRRTGRPNARDAAANVMVQTDAAVVMASWLYQPGDLALLRRERKAVQVQAWQRPTGMRARAHPKSWSAQEDLLVMAPRPVAELAEELSRSTSAVVMRRWRLRQAASDES